jgi:transposase
MIYLVFISKSELCHVHLGSSILASRQCFPNAEITLDHFHIVKALNESLDAVRKSLRKAYQTHQEFKNIKWLLFKQAQNCTEEQTHLLNLAFEKVPLYTSFIYNVTDSIPFTSVLLMLKI